MATPDSQKNLSSKDLRGIKERLSKGELSKDDITQLMTVIDLVIGLRAALESKSIQVVKWLRRIFGLKTEKSDQKKPKRSDENTEKPGGPRGRNGRDDYPGANKIKVSHPDH